MAHLVGDGTLAITSSTSRRTWRWWSGLRRSCSASAVPGAICMAVLFAFDPFDMETVAWYRPSSRHAVGVLLSLCPALILRFDDSAARAVCPRAVFFVLVLLTKSVTVNTAGRDLRSPGGAWPCLSAARRSEPLLPLLRVGATLGIVTLSSSDVCRGDRREPRSGASSNAACSWTGRLASTSREVGVALDLVFFYPARGSLRHAAVVVSLPVAVLIVLAVVEDSRVVGVVRGMLMYGMVLGPARASSTSFPSRTRSSRTTSSTWQACRFWRSSSGQSSGFCKRACRQS